MEVSWGWKESKEKASSLCSCGTPLWKVRPKFWLLLSLLYSGFLARVCLMKGYQTVCGASGRSGNWGRVRDGCNNPHGPLSQDSGSGTCGS